MLIALLVLAGCKKKAPPEKGPDVVDVQRVETPLQITTMTPSVAQAGAVLGVPASLFGSGFEDGARVSFGTASATNVVVVDPNSIEFVLPDLGVGSYDVSVAVGDRTTSLRQGFVVEGEQVAQEDCNVARVEFDFNSAALTRGSQQALDAFMPCYQRRSGVVKIAGHADERGTTDYNLALGQRRADAVERYLREQGVSKGRLQTVSYGEERPVDSSSSEAAWRKNRRAEVESR